MRSVTVSAVGSSVSPPEASATAPLGFVEGGGARLGKGDLKLRPAVPHADGHADLKQARGHGGSHRAGARDEPRAAAGPSAAVPSGEILAVHPRGGAGPPQEVTHDLVHSGGIIDGGSAGAPGPAPRAGPHTPPGLEKQPPECGELRA